MPKSLEEKRVPLGACIIAASLTLVVGVVLGILWHQISPSILPYLGAKVSQAQDWSALDEVYAELKANYDGDLDQSALVEGAKKGLVAAVGDAYTAYMTADEARDYQASLHGEAGSGIGVEMALRDGYVRIIRTLPDNPAVQAGVKAGDIIYKIDDEEVYSASIETISAKLRGEAGTQVKLSVVRDGVEKSFDLTRAPINNVSAYIDYYDHIAKITLTRFDTDTGTLVEQFVTSDEFKRHQVEKVILDLRGNGGGYVSAAQDLLSLWIDGQAIFTQKSKHSDEDITYAKRGHAVLADLPTVVLVNGTSASASEIVAGALKDYGKAYLIGEQTYGKGVVQTLRTLSGQSLLKVTTAKWYTPLGVNISDQGIAPDSVVELSYADANAGRDPQLDAAKNWQK